MGIPALHLELYARSSNSHLLLCNTHAFLFFPLFSFFPPSFCSIIVLSCLSSKHHQSRKYPRFTGKPKAIHSAESFFVQNDGFTVLCITWQCLNSQRKLQFDKRAGTGCCHHAKPWITHTRQGGMMVIHHIPLWPLSSQVPFLCCWDWWRLFPLPDLSSRSPKCVKKWDGTVSTCSFLVQEKSGIVLGVSSTPRPWWWLFWVALLGHPPHTHCRSWSHFWYCPTVYLRIPDTVSAAQALNFRFSVSPCMSSPPWLTPPNPSHGTGHLWHWAIHGAPGRTGNGIFLHLSPHPSALLAPHRHPGI